MTYEKIYTAGYEDGVHDGYYSSSIEDGIEEKYFGKSYQELPTSDDCVNRAEVFEIMGNLMSIPYDFDRPINDDDVSESMDKIKALPPITPTRKVGKWEKTRYRSYDPQSCETYDDGIGFRCSNCANAFKVESLARYHYCPNCGAEMRGNNVDKKR